VHFHSIVGLVLAAVLLDGAVQMCNVLSLRSLYMLAPELRGRLNGIFFTLIFLCAALASGLSAALYAFHGWNALCLLGAAFSLAATVFYITEFRHKALA
jgi:cyanate permease